jgi:hypothetical protein
VGSVGRYVKLKKESLLSLRAIILSLCSVLLATNAIADVRLDCYQYPDKALTVHAGGNFVDPYFTNRALITAHQLGLDIQTVAHEWIGWALAHQEPDGRFARYCLADNKQQWRRCEAADADDASLALWQQLLFLMSPENTLFGPWQLSAQLAKQQLDRLYDTQHGIYFVSPSEHYSLLMDNVEVYDTLRTIARQQHKLGATSLAAYTTTRATKLQQAINRVFWREDSQTYTVTTQPEEPTSFYPHIVAQVYPWLFGMPGPVNTQQAYRHWRSQYVERWLSFTQDKYPWGLVAAAADKLGDRATTERWLQQASLLRDSKRWNILEEAIYQALAKKYAVPVNLDCKRDKS